MAFWCQMWHLLYCFFQAFNIKFAFLALGCWLLRCTIPSPSSPTLVAGAIFDEIAARWDFSHLHSTSNKKVHKLNLQPPSNAFQLKSLRESNLQLIPMDLKDTLKLMLNSTPGMRPTAAETAKVNDVKVDKLDFFVAHLWNLTLILFFHSDEIVRTLQLPIRCQIWHFFGIFAPLCLIRNLEMTFLVAIIYYFHTFNIEFAPCEQCFFSKF